MLSVSPGRLSAAWMQVLCLIVSIKYSSAWNVEVLHEYLVIEWIHPYSPCTTKSSKEFCHISLMCVTHTLPTSSPLSVPVVVSQAFLTLCLSFQATLQYSTLLTSVFCCIVSLQKPKPFHSFPVAYSIKSSSSVGLLLIRSLPVFPTSFLSLPWNEPSAPAALSRHCPWSHCLFPPLVRWCPRISWHFASGRHSPV